jgi:hypothetical protein
MIYHFSGSPGLNWGYSLKWFKIKDVERRFLRRRFTEDLKFGFVPVHHEQRETVTKEDKKQVWKRETTSEVI